ncbi:hypothetical protein GWN42_25445 [candidate division KSB1 bacterium]|nr:hypothetical protein [candidate division KSB1 bacterium]NIS26546.1 hypothetical protein [candidate division KSB1 bacterium]NIU23932.1 hypothetical protein [candidate division KSB1 bacterium]NIU91286.1 hypothetical protein [candidate division KSB1 bacterium]NIV96039.1 hypothetical protein [candidate division KSB1 bacterium]
MAAPANLVATPVSSMQIELTWNDNATDEKGYRVERRVATVVDKVKEIGGNSIRYRDVMLNPNTEYTYRVRAFRDMQASNSSNTAAATTFSNDGPWFELTSETEKDLHAVAYVDEEIATVVGETGSIRRTKDLGESWTGQGSGTANKFHDVFFLDVNSGTAVSSVFPSGTAVIRRTLNGGLVWSDPPPTSLTEDLWAVTFADEDTGMIVGASGTVLRTTNNGLNWAAQESEITSDLFAVHLISPDTGVAVGSSGMIIKTIDGGNDWLVLASGTMEDLYGVCFTAADTGTVVGSNGLILRTTDGGANWISQNSGVSNDLFEIHFTSQDTAYAVGSSGVILKTTDGGANWKPLYSNTSNTLYDIWFLDSEHGMISGEYGTVLWTDSGGE